MIDAITRPISVIFGALWDRVVNEPVLTLGVVQAGLACAVGFGLQWSGEQVALVVTFSAAILGFIARRQVTPNSRLP